MEGEDEGWIETRALSVWDDKGFKDQCMELYCQAANQRTESYNRLSAQLDAQVAQIGKQNQLSVGGVGDPFSPLLAARSEAVTAARDKHNRYSGAENNDESAKERWYADDREAFIAADTHGEDGVLDQAEFQAVVKEILNLEEADARKLLEAWDIDNSKSIGPVEWVTFMSVLRAEKHYHEQKYMCKELQDLMDDLLPGGELCGTLCSYWGPCCSLCTLCTSWLCFCAYWSIGNRFATKHALSVDWQTEYDHRMGQAKEASITETQHSAAKKLLEGPNGNLIAACKSIQKLRPETEKSPLLSTAGR